MKLQNWLRLLSKYLSVMITSINHSESDVVFLMYHRVTGNVDLEIDVKFSAFKKQMIWLSQNYDVISITDALALCKSNSRLNASRKAIVLTFDDAYRDFYSHVWPLLKELKLPSTLYVPTDFINDPNNLPITVNLKENERLEPMTWDMIKEVYSDDLVTIGAHGHTHSEFSNLDIATIKQEIEKSDMNFIKELDFKPKHFAYPRGAWNHISNEILKKRYNSIALVGGGGVNFSKLNSFKIPRVPVLKSDKFNFFTLRTQEKLKYDELLTDLIRKRK